MKGIIVQCMAELVTKKFGDPKWKEALTKADLANLVPVAGANIEDAKVLALIGAVGETLGLTGDQVGDAFGDYWVNDFAVRVYGAYFRAAKNAREFLLAMDGVHQKTTERMEGARPPRFFYKWKNDNTLVMTYESKRNLVSLMIGLVKGVGRYYKQNLDVALIGNNQVEIKFQ